MGKKKTAKAAVSLTKFGRFREAVVGWDRARLRCIPLAEKVVELRNERLYLTSSSLSEAGLSALKPSLVNVQQENELLARYVAVRGFIVYV